MGRTGVIALMLVAQAGWLAGHGRVLCLGADGSWRVERNGAPCAECPDRPAPEAVHDGCECCPECHDQSVDEHPAPAECPGKTSPAAPCEEGCTDCRCTHVPLGDGPVSPSAPPAPHFPPPGALVGAWLAGQGDESPAVCGNMSTGMNRPPPLLEHLSTVVLRT
jgi:hypothetical protein